MVLNKYKAIDYLYQYSKYHGNLMFDCESINNDGHGFASLILLFNILESVLKNAINDFDSNFFELITKAQDNNLINNYESDFLNNKQFGIRKIRNILSHANLSKYNYILENQDSALMYPFTENSNCVILYEYLSPIIVNIMLKCVSNQITINLEIDCTDEIINTPLKLVELSPIELLKLKGFNDQEINQIVKGNSESINYLLAENASDINLIANIFKKISIY